MEQASLNLKCEFGDQTTSDITIHLKSKQNGRSQHFSCHSAVLTKASNYFSDQIARNPIESGAFIEIQCNSPEFEHYAKLFGLLYVPEESVLEKLNSVRSTVGVLKAADSLSCERVKKACVEYLEAVPWDEKEEEEIVKLVKTLGPEAARVLARVKPVSETAAKDVFISAIRFATSVASPIAGFSDELKTSAQEQLEYMILSDPDGPLVVVDEDVRSEMQSGLKQLIKNLMNGLDLLSSEREDERELAEEKMMIVLSDLDWVCNLTQRMEIMVDFVTDWAEISSRIVTVVLSTRCGSGLWAVKAKILEITNKALDAVGYGSVVLPAPARVQFLRTWLPYIRELKPLLESRMDSDIWENMEGAIVSYVLALPSSDQAEIILEWVNRSDQMQYPDLSEAFEVWCYRAKSGKRRLAAGVNGVENHTVSF